MVVFDGRCDVSAHPGESLLCGHERVIKLGERGILNNFCASTCESGYGYGTGKPTSSDASKRTATESCR